MSFKSLLHRSFNVRHLFGSNIHTNNFSRCLFSTRLSPISSCAHLTRASSCSFLFANNNNRFKMRSTHHPLFSICLLSTKSGTTTSGEDLSGLDVNSEEQLEKEKARQRQQRVMKYTLVFLTALAGGSLVYMLSEWGKPRRDENGEEIKDDFSEMGFLKQYIYRTWDTLMHYNEVLREPSRELLLPPPLQAPYYQPPYTLVIEMTGVLVHPEWTYKTGWRFKKRPFVDYFLQQCATSSLFEIVIYTYEQGFTAFPLLESLDPNGFIMYRLFRDSTRYQDGVHMKDLTCLNRDLTKVIHVDWNKEACKFTPNNCLNLKKWDGDSNDRTLLDLTNFLKAIAVEGVDDVRDVLNHYSKFDDPIEAFKENQRKLAEQEKEREKVKAPSRSLLGSWGTQAPKK